MRTNTKDIILDKTGWVRANDVLHSPSPNYGGGVIDPRFIVLHDTDTRLDIAGAVSWLTNPAARASAHFVVGRNGEIHQLVPVCERAWHCGRSGFRGLSDLDGYSIGVAMVSPGRLRLSSSGREAVSGFGAKFKVRTYDIQEKRGSYAHLDGWYMPYTEDQIHAVSRLSILLRDTLNITKILGHYEVSDDRTDPNPLFPLDRLRDHVHPEPTTSGL